MIKHFENALKLRKGLYYTDFFKAHDDDHHHQRDCTAIKNQLTKTFG